jgi:membrane associated rhomboid family serine protease
MLPLRDENPSNRIPYVNYALIGLNILVFLWQLVQMENNPSQVFAFALIPAEVTNGIQGTDVLHILTSMFMHGGIAHIAGNMLYLWIFGDNIEDTFGHGRYLLFYLVGGLAAALAHILTDPLSTIPTVGASGAIAAVLGAYLVLFPRRRVLTLVIFGFFARLAYIPAVIVLGLWGILQLFQGLLALGGPGGMGGIAFWAHIGGFAFGLALGRLLGTKQATYYYPGNYR